MLKLLQCEAVKIRRSRIFLIGILGTLIVPFFVVINAITKYIANPETTISLFSLYDNALMFLMLLFAPLVLTILSAWIISREYTDGTLKNILVIPISRTAFLAGKLLFLAILTFLFLLLSCGEVFVLACLFSLFVPVTGLTVPTFLFFLGKMLFGGVLLCATQTPFLYLTIRTREFVAPLIAIAVVSLVNVVLSNSRIAGFYPWSASYILVSGHGSGAGCPKGISLAIILAVGLLGIGGSLVRFRREEVK